MSDESIRRPADWAAGTDALADRFVELNNVFMKSIRFSIAGLFRRKEFGPLRQDVEVLLEQLDGSAALIGGLDLQDMEAKDLIVKDFQDYAKCLRRTCEILGIIVRNMDEKTQGRMHYPTQAYVNDLRNYESAVAYYLELEPRFKARIMELSTPIGTINKKHSP